MKNFEENNKDWNICIKESISNIRKEYLTKIKKTYSEEEINISNIYQETIISFNPKFRIELIPQPQIYFGNNSYPMIFKDFNSMILFCDAYLMGLKYNKG